jgi:hypothetical protein
MFFQLGDCMNVVDKLLITCLGPIVVSTASVILHLGVSVPMPNQCAIPTRLCIIGKLVRTDANARSPMAIHLANIYTYFKYFCIAPSYTAYTAALIILSLRRATYNTCNFSRYPLLRLFLLFLPFPY